MKKLLLTLFLLASLTVGVLPVKALIPSNEVIPVQVKTNFSLIISPNNSGSIHLPSKKLSIEIPPILDVYIRAPEGWLATPYVILSGIQTSSNLSQGYYH